MKNKQISETLSFRLSPQLMRLLDQRAEEEGVSRGDLARQLVTAALADTQQDELRLQMEGMAKEILRSREDLATAVTALLTRDGPVSLEEAKAWVRSKLLK